MEGENVKKKFRQKKRRSDKKGRANTEDWLRNIIKRENK